LKVYGLANPALNIVLTLLNSAGDYAKLVMALAACLLGYGEVGLWLKKSSRSNTWVKVEGNQYQKWIDDYSGQWYQDAVKTGIGESWRIPRVSGQV
jgi:thiaminase